MSDLASLQQRAINDGDSQLAIELACEISDVPVILERHNLSATALKRKLRDPAFQNMFKQAKRVWQGDLSVEDRIKLKAQVLLEDSLLAIYSIVHDKELVPSARLDGFKSLAKVAHADQAEKAAGGTGQKVQININIPTVEPVVLDVAAPPAEEFDAAALEFDPAA